MDNFIVGKVQSRNISAIKHYICFNFSRLLQIKKNLLRLELKRFNDLWYPSTDIYLYFSLGILICCIFVRERDTINIILEFSRTKYCVFRQYLCYSLICYKNYSQCVLVLSVRSIVCFRRVTSFHLSVWTDFEISDICNLVAWLVNVP